MATGKQLGNGKPDGPRKRGPKPKGPPKGTPPKNQANVRVSSVTNPATKVQENLLIQEFRGLREAAHWLRRAAIARISRILETGVAAGPTVAPATVRQIEMLARAAAAFHQVETAGHNWVDRGAAVAATPRHTRERIGGSMLYQIADRHNVLESARGGESWAVDALLESSSAMLASDDWTLEPAGRP